MASPAAGLAEQLSVDSSWSQELSSNTGAWVAEQLLIDGSRAATSAAEAEAVSVDTGDERQQASTCFGHRCVGEGDAHKGPKPSDGGKAAATAKSPAAAVCSAERAAAVGSETGVRHSCPMARRKASAAAEARGGSAIAPVPAPASAPASRHAARVTWASSLQVSSRPGASCGDAAASRLDDVGQDAVGAEVGVSEGKTLPSGPRRRHLPSTIAQLLRRPLGSRLSAPPLASCASGGGAAGAASGAAAPSVARSAGGPGVRRAGKQRSAALTGPAAG
mmetsp:Transcript_42176/g.121872  ORF Transcript_42176/g.121872 Transcript_42176/m.121872 type:complete len:277 (+) Transcript_42176:451-1281(+)